MVGMIYTNFALQHRNAHMHTCGFPLKSTGKSLSSAIVETKNAVMEIMTSFIAENNLSGEGEVSLQAPPLHHLLYLLHQSYAYLLFTHPSYACSLHPNYTRSPLVA